MTAIGFRPWGLLPWVLRKTNQRSWNLFGCIATEERCLSTFRFLQANNALDRVKFVEIHDPPTPRFHQKSVDKLHERRQQFVASGGNTQYIEEHQLFEPTDILVQSFTYYVGHATGNLVLDISSLPKRFFFPLTRLALQNSTIQNLLITYAVPAAYTNEALAEDPEPWRHLPLFPTPYPEPTIKVLVVGVGFETLGLPQLENSYQDVAVKLLIPFPPGPPSFQRTWEFVRSLESNGLRPKTIVPVDARDTSDAFDHIRAATENGSVDAIFAPYGPKPLSLAIAIYATLKESAVFYTQPRAYNPEYSVGVSQVNSDDEVYAYCIRLNGRNLYSL